jgi:membrane-associated phospholipid phosphatase
MSESTVVLSRSDMQPRRRNLPIRLTLLALVIALELLYVPVNRAASGGVILKLPIDDLIPLWSMWAVPYLISIVWWTAAFVWAAFKMPDDLYNALITGMIGVMLISYAIYLIFPTYVLRPDLSGTDWATSLVRAIYSGDRAYCAFPSGHTYATMLITLFWWKWQPRLRPLWGITALIVLLSTLFTRQHYVLDVVGGIAMAFAGHYGGLWLESRRIFERAGKAVHGQSGVWLWGLGLGGILAVSLSMFVIYGRMPVDGATGDLESFKPDNAEGFTVQWLLEKRPDELLPGDIVQRVDGYTVEEWLNGVQPADHWRTGGIAEYKILRDGEAITLPIVLRPTSLLSVLRRWSLQLLVALALMIVGPFVFIKRPGDLPARLFALYVYAVGLQLIGDTYNFQFAAIPNSVLWYQLLIEHLSYSILFATLSHFALLFPVRHPLIERYPRLLPLILYAASPLLILLAMVIAPTRSDALVAGNRVSVLSVIPFILLMIAAFVNAMRTSPDAVARAQVRWMVWALAVASVIGLPGYMLPLAITGRPFIPHEVITLVPIFVPSVIAITILRYRLFDIEVIINRTLVYGALTVLLGGVFFLVMLGLQRLFMAATGGQQSPFAIAAAALVIGGLFQPIRKRLQTFVDRRFYGIKVDYSTRLDSSISTADLIGRHLGSFEILSPLGRGGMSEVFLGRHMTLDRSVAIKILPSQYASQTDFRKRFEMEARIVAGLRHPNIVQLFDFGDVDGSYYMVMEYLDGQNLDDYLTRSGPLSLRMTGQIMQDVGSALDYAHAQGLVHRDVKPSNIMLQKATAPGADREFRAVLTDFGIARLLTGDTGITKAGVIGTLDYMSPEQIRAEKLDARSDVYSLGVMAFNLLTGSLPFAADNPGTLVLAHLQAPPPDPRSLRPDLPEIITATLLRAMAKDPAARFASAGEFAAALTIGESKAAA